MEIASDFQKNGKLKIENGKLNTVAEALFMLPSPFSIFNFQFSVEEVFRFQFSVDKTTLIPLLVRLAGWGRLACRS